ncbi:mitochondrial carrier [Microstroma glucosiphilum]|uniref:Mitochondrial carrier n=1 Tax=Pseudomicrostroma glucosiphilum TaxID=1684307 RepID=A0A316TX74_9BASI|nr:mitochondrial carrier [Pseudomicrostroma glucosiphilum]PWN17907.1 mitochondrial carrier [Pseudomicrostroma glucosiphilum]
MPTLGPSAIAGACAGLVSSIVTCPLDVVKTKLQAQSTSKPAVKAPNVVSGGSSSAGGTIAGPSKSGPAAAVRGAGSASVGGASLPPHAFDGEGDRVYRGLLGTLRTIYKYDGIRGFYRGLGPTIFGYLPTWAIYFTVYDGCKEFLAKNAGDGEEDFINHIVSALTAGGASTVCTSPLWVVKTRFMLQSAKPRDPMQPPPYKHTLDAFIRIMQEEGPRGFYRGLLPSLMGVSHVAVQFPLYETFKSWAREASGSNGEGGLGGADLPPRVILACSSSAKMIASVLTYPHEVVRTRLQMHPRSKAPNTTAAAAAAAASAAANGAQGAQTIRTPTPAAAGSEARRGFSTVASSSSTNTNTIDTRRHHTSTTLSPLGTRASPSYFTPHFLRTRPQSTSSTAAASATAAAASGAPPQKYTSLLRTVGTIFREEGLRGFYNGMGVNLVRTVPSSALTILTYEVMMQHLTGGGGKGDEDEGGGEQGTREER